jgi:hypothetical protein
MYVRKETRKTREATREFEVVLDERGFRERMETIRLERVLGFNRVIGDRVNPPNQSRGSGGNNKKLRELLLPGKGKATRDGKGKGKAPLADQDEEIALDTDMRKSGNAERSEHWFHPPPPYVHSSSYPTGDHKHDRGITKQIDPSMIISLGMDTGPNPQSPRYPIRTRST